ncbi:MAG: ABC transporter substrate-binding protein [Bacteroidota bacterium]
MKIFVAIDDTDNLESKGTGFRARELAALLEQNQCGQIIGVTRHQLFFNEQIPYTSHNSSACVSLESSKEKSSKIIELSASYLIANAAEGSDAGLCVCLEDKVTDELKNYAIRAKSEVLTMDTSYNLATKLDIFLEGYTGTRQGIIGSLAAVGLHAGGNDGRFLLAKGMREIFGTFQAQEILINTGIEEIKTINNQNFYNFETILLTEWWRPVLKKHKAVLYVEPVNNEEYEYRVISKERIKIISN